MGSNKQHNHKWEVQQLPMYSIMVNKLINLNNNNHYMALKIMDTHKCNPNQWDKQITSVLFQVDKVITRRRLSNPTSPAQIISYKPPLLLPNNLNKLKTFHLTSQIQVLPQISFLHAPKINEVVILSYRKSYMINPYSSKSSARIVKTLTKC